MSKVLGYIIGKFGLDFLLRAIYLGLLGLYYFAIVAMWGSFVVAFSYFFNEVQSTLDMITLGSSDSTVSHFYGLLSCVGFIDALNNTKPIWLSGLAFIFSRVMYSGTINAYTLLLRSITPLLGR